MMRKKLLRHLPRCGIKDSGYGGYAAMRFLQQKIKRRFSRGQLPEFVAGDRQAMTRLSTYSDDDVLPLILARRLRRSPVCRKICLIEFSTVQIRSC